MAFNNTLSRTWDRTTPRDGLLLQTEFQRLLDNDIFLKGAVDVNSNNITSLSNLINSLLIPLGGMVEDSIDQLASSNFKEANGQAISRTSFTGLWNLIHKTITSITPATDRLNLIAHGCIEGQLVKFAFTGGGVTALTKYYVRNPTANDFQISTTPTGSIIDLTASQSGDMITNVEYGFGDGSTTFNVPDRRGIFMRGAGVHGTRAKAANGNFNGGAVGFEGQDQGHDHIHGPAGNYLRMNPGTAMADGNTFGVLTAIGGPAANGSNGSPRLGDETTPAYVAVKYKVRVA
ncbi:MULTISPECIES: hypothetical protein [Leptospira]|uniref:Phage tail collar domain protein n=1 Tax=Leptospira borgpetersenii serovar Javanica str. UI 09931 TaxID=1049767 RepID=A0AAV3J8J4_LEPBO|nr:MULTISPECIES: hypothetical protein [Leptospira]EKQ90534.1 hypothetical protein LEP1GSC101_0429 [Leptospira borgpetersenii str. UI 09149]EMK12871.1 hypothetical protein LEP1GSC066_1084 [Leptospira sp. serovar Kenya str. Sh9]EMN59705.1 hypothetical protein LEP1GSC090_2713 [Leptospira borgpetersenii serovar Javanica str. MK146]EPG55949.1 hypothetical protein LEP1GSC103_0670 [Leptospira borgpetersenii serovar Javanica str. UI 09931]MDQ7245907.1 hypothetical protein [Leptospira borgpetersenii]